ncbi:MAG: signal peptidase II [Phycisphaerae bacterium]|nr:signal peptidase II [Phycisphaerae bacterium]
MKKQTSQPEVTSQPPRRERWACYHGVAVVLFVLIAAFAATADLWSKHAVFQRLLDNPAIEQNLDVLAGAPEFAHWRVDNQWKQDPGVTRKILRQLKIQERVCYGLTFTLLTNPGVVFGIDAIPDGVVNIITVLMIVAVCVFFATSPRRGYWLHVALALILGGAIGNLYDRLFSCVPLPHMAPICHQVRDFINCSELGYSYIFNVADAWLVVGVAMIMLHWLWSGRKEAKRGK